MTMPKDKLASPLRAFSLIEATIVLAVVGIVIGGIWTATARVSTERRLDTIARNILLGANKMRAVLTTQDATPDGNGWTITPIRNLAIMNKYFPGIDVVNGKFKTGFGASTSFNPGWEMDVGMLRTGGLDYFMVTTILPTNAMCQIYAAKVTSFFRNKFDLAFLWFVDANNVIRGRTSWPLSPTDSSGTAGFNPPCEVRLFFTLTSGR